MKTWTMKTWTLVGLLAAIPVGALAQHTGHGAATPAPAPSEARPFDFHSFGSFRRLSHTGDTSGQVKLADLPQSPGHWGMGALAGLSGEVLLVDGTPIQTIIDRISGCKTVAERYPDIKIVGQQASKNDRASGLAVTTDMLTANPDVTGIFGMNDPSALGAVLAVEQAGKSGQIIVTGVDGSPEAVAELTREGSPFVGSATQNPGEMVRQAIKIAQDMVAGNPPAEKTILIESVLVTRDSVKDYAGW